MKAVILAGGFGTRISEETYLKPKPMIEIGGKPILWHIMKIYSANDINDFVICCGYKGYMIKEYFKNYFLHMSDVTFDIRNNEMEVHRKFAEPWKITLVDTGINTMTGGRLKKVEEHVKNETFCLTYGDGVANINIKKLIDFHKKSKTFATLTGVQPPGRFGILDTKNHYYYRDLVDLKALKLINKNYSIQDFINEKKWKIPNAALKYCGLEKDVKFDVPLSYEIIIKEELKVK